MDTTAVPKSVPQKSRWHKWQSPLHYLGWGIFGGGVLFSILIFFPVLREEWRYFSHVTLPERFPILEASGLIVPHPTSLRPIDTQFGIVIPKIGANTHVIANTNWQDSSIYQHALTKGVAHAKGTALPGESGNIFIFAHSGANFDEALEYNAVFYLMNKLKEGDEIDLYYQDKRYRYTVSDIKKVKSDATEYLKRDSPEPMLTLMTCWPAGTTFERLIVQATPIP